MYQQILALFRVLIRAIFVIGTMSYESNEVEKAPSYIREGLLYRSCCVSFEANIC